MDLLVSSPKWRWKYCLLAFHMTSIKCSWLQMNIALWRSASLMSWHGQTTFPILLCGGRKRVWCNLDSCLLLYLPFSLIEISKIYHDSSQNQMATGVTPDPFLLPQRKIGNSGLSAHFHLGNDSWEYISTWYLGRSGVCLQEKFWIVDSFWCILRYFSATVPATMHHK